MWATRPSSTCLRLLWAAWCLSPSSTPATPRSSAVYRVPASIADLKGAASSWWSYVPLRCFGCPITLSTSYRWDLKLPMVQFNSLSIWIELQCRAIYCLGSKATGDLPIQRCNKCIPLQLHISYKGLKWATDSLKCSLVVKLSHAQTSIFIHVNTSILQFIWQYGRPGLSVLHTQGGATIFVILCICSDYLFCILLVITSFPCSPPLTFLFILLQVTGLLQDKASVINAAKIARPNVTAFAYFSSAANPVLYVFAGSSHIRQAGLSFMGKLFEGTYSESRTTSTRTGRISSSSKENTVLQSLSVKLGKPFKGKNNNMSSVVGQNEPELKTLASVEPLD